MLAPRSMATWHQLRSWLTDRATEQALIEAYVSTSAEPASLAPADRDNIARAADNLAARRATHRR